jgi:methylated-DNA-protein-cysteine methyltransferase-like protein
MVGWAMNQSHTSHEYVPAHRVVNRNGMLTGKHHFDGTNLMQEMLENEGAVIRENRILNMKAMFWDPVEELGL